jgi:hypothetical protein
MSQTVRRLLCQDLLVDFENSLEVHIKVYVKIVYSCWLESKRSQTVEKLSGQNLLVYFESYLKVHVKMYVKVYVKVVYSWFGWGRKQSRNCWVRFSVLHFVSLVLNLSIIRGQSKVVKFRVLHTFSFSELSEI